MITKKNIEELFEMLEPNIEMNTGSSGEGQYGYYCEWQSLNYYDDHVLSDLQNYILNEFPKIKRFNKRDEIISSLRSIGFPEETAYEHELNFPTSQVSFSE